jgi:triacylglycerol esterase/lipase EstA (alpha/beta hydrolase family)
MVAKRFVLLCWLIANGCAADGLDDVEVSAGAIVSEPAQATRPIVLVAGMTQNEDTVAPLAAALRAREHDVTVYVPSNDGLDDIHSYAKELATTVDAVRLRTNAAKIDLIGHSEGGLTARQYVKDQLANAPVQSLISLGSPQQAPTLARSTRCCARWASNICRWHWSR